MSDPRTARIRELNDAFRRSFSGGKVTMTAGVYALPDMVKAAALQKAATFDEFNEDNDPHGEHDFGSSSCAAGSSFGKSICMRSQESRAKMENPSSIEC